MQHLQRGPERVHLCKRKKNKVIFVIDIEIKHTKIQQSQFVFLNNHFHRSSLCVSHLIHNKHILAATRS